MRTLTSCLLLFLMVHTTKACVWITGTKYNGSPVKMGGYSMARRLDRVIKVNPADKGAEMERDLRNSTNFNDRSDYSVALMYLGRANEAVNLLKSLEQENPGQYIIAANLGTAYELSGDNTNALRWIQEGIRRDHNSHYGTEWLHVKILQARIAAKNDSDYFKNHTILGFHPGSPIEPLSMDGRTVSPAEIGEALEYQLEERVQFVKPRDPAVAALLFDYAIQQQMTATLESARGLLQIAMEYGYPPDQIQPLMDQFDQKIASRKTRQMITYVVLVLAGIGLLIILYKKGIFVLSSKDLKKRRAS